METLDITGISSSRAMWPASGYKGSKKLRTKKSLQEASRGPGSIASALPAQILSNGVSHQVGPFSEVRLSLMLTSRKVRSAVGHLKNPGIQQDTFRIQDFCSQKRSHHLHIVFV